MSVDPAIVQWLKDGLLTSSSADAAVIARWGALATTTRIDSPLAMKADAIVEAARQIGFLGGPLVLDEHDVPGRRSDLKQRCITLSIARLGYDEGVPCFVIAADESAKGDVTTLTIVRRL